MYKNLSTNTKLLVVSDTGVFKSNNNEFKAFGPVVIELENLLSEFDEITWIGFNKKDQNTNRSYTRVKNKRIKIVLLKNVGGKSIISKSRIIFYYPSMFFTVLKEIIKHRYIHTRAPSNPAVIAMFLSLFFYKKRFWHKYAGTWTEKASFFYEFQRFFLKKMFRNSIITINGNFDSRKRNILSFENPCLTEKDVERGRSILKNKNNDSNVFCFVGNLTYQKGVDLIIKALEAFSMGTINEFHFVGGGDLKHHFIEKTKNIKIKVIFHDYLQKNKIAEIYSKSNFVVLPSKSEGFPKVIGEAINYGCIPIVSDISCISDYIQDGFNGFLINPITVEDLTCKIQEAIKLDSESRNQIINYNNTNLVKKFTYNYYNYRVKNEVFKINKC